MTDLTDAPGDSLDVEDYAHGRIETAFSDEELTNLFGESASDSDTAASAHALLSTTLSRLCELLSDTKAIIDGRFLDALFLDISNAGAEEIALRSLWLKSEKLTRYHLSRKVVPGLVRVTEARLEAAGLSYSRTIERNSDGRRLLNASLDYLHAVEDAISTPSLSSVPGLLALIECRNSWLYVCACLGDRNAMIALSSGIEGIPCRAQETTHKSFEDKVRMITRAWNMLASFRAAFPCGFGSPGMDTSSLDFADLELDLRYPDEIVHRLEHVGLEVQAIRNDDTFEPRKQAKIEAKGKTPSRSEIVVLDEISGGGDGDTDIAIHGYGILLSPLPLAGTKKSADEVFTLLDAEFPWLEEANLWFAESVAISHATGRGWFHSPPGLLLGNPGIGKSRWARRAAELAGVPFGTIPLSGAHTSVIISGVERGWKGGRPGTIATIIRDFETANPLVLLDEIDKVGRGSNNGNVVDALLPLLEPETASRFYDSYLLGRLNLSKTTFIMTANNSGFAGPFLDRVRILNCGEPQRHHFERVVDNILKDVASELGFGSPNGPAAPDITDLLPYFERVFVKSGSVRALRKVMEAGIRKRIWMPRNGELH